MYSARNNACGGGVWVGLKCRWRQKREREGYPWAAQNAQTCSRQDYSSDLAKRQR